MDEIGEIDLEGIVAQMYDTLTTSVQDKVVELIDSNKIPIKRRHKQAFKENIPEPLTLYIVNYVSAWLRRSLSDQDPSITTIDVGEVIEKSLMELGVLYTQFERRTIRKLRPRNNFYETRNLSRLLGDNVIDFLARCLGIRGGIQYFDEEDNYVKTVSIDVLTLLNYAVSGYYLEKLRRIYPSTESQPLGSIERYGAVLVTRKPWELLFLPPVEGVEYHSFGRVTKIDLNVCMNWDPFDNIVHEVDTCRFNFQDQTLGSLLDVADEHIHYLALESLTIKRNVPRTLGIVIFHDSEGVSDDNHGKKYILVEGFFGRDALQLVARSETGQPSEPGQPPGYAPIFEYIFDHLVKIAYNTGRELIFNVSFNTSHTSQGNLEWANFLVRKLCDPDKDLYLKRKARKDPLEGDVFRENDKLPRLETNWPTIKLRKKPSAIDEIFTPYRYANAYFRDYRKRLLAQWGSINRSNQDPLWGQQEQTRKHFEFQWNRTEGNVRYVGVDLNTLDRMITTIDGKIYHHRRSLR